MILVTGGAGFIGSNLVASLSERGEEVAVCDRIDHEHKRRNLAKHRVAALVDPDGWRAACGKFASRMRAVVHLGAISATTETDADRVYATNVGFSRALWRWCVEHGTPFIYASSAATYGDGSAGFEDGSEEFLLARLRPLNAYACSKHAFDREIARAVAAGDPTPPQWVGLKPFNVYGPNEHHKGAMRSVVTLNYARVRDGEPMRLFRSCRPDYPDGGQRRDFIYVRDCVAAILWLLDHPQVSGLLNLGTGQARTWLDLAHALFKALDRAPRIEFIDMPESVRASYQYHTEARIDRLRACGFSAPFASLEEGIADYVRNYLANDDPYR